IAAEAEAKYDVPSAKTVAVAKEVTQAEYANLLKDLPIDFSKQVTTPEDMARIMQVALDKINAFVEADQQWTVVLNPKGISLAADQETQSVKVATTKTWPVDTVAGLVAHEL